MAAEARHWCQIWVSTNGTEISVRTFPPENKKFSLHYKVNRVSLGSLVGIATSTVFSCSTGFPMKWHLRNEHRISKLMMHDHPDLNGASDWLKQICHAAWQITGFTCTLKVLPWWNYSCCGRTKKDRLKALFCTEWSPSKMGKVFLKVLEKVHEFFVPKRVQTLQSEALTRFGEWHVISMEFLHSFLRHHFAKKSVVVLWNVAVFSA